MSAFCHTQTRALLLAVLKQYSLMYITHYSRFLLYTTCTDALLTTLHYFYLADADQRSAAGSSRAPSARGRDASKHPRAARARGLIELIACHAGWLRHAVGCTTLVAATAIGSTFSEHARTYIHTDHGGAHPQRRDVACAGTSDRPSTGVASRNGQGWRQAGSRSGRDAFSPTPSCRRHYHHQHHRRRRRRHRRRTTLLPSPSWSWTLRVPTNRDVYPLKSLLLHSHTLFIRHANAPAFQQL